MFGLKIATKKDIDKNQIPKFPDFKELELSDKAEIESFIKGFPTYSDYDFASLWAWDIKKRMRVSEYNGNLVIKFTDYITEEPFYSFFGTNAVNEIAAKLLAMSVQEELEPKLKLLPEIAVKKLDPTIFEIYEDRDNFDYIYLIEDLVNYKGSGLKTQRNFLTRFLKDHSSVQVRSVDLSNEKYRLDLLNLYKKWEENNGFNVPHESLAFNRFLQAQKDFESISIGLFDGDKLIAFSINEKSENEYINCLFAKADVNYQGIYSFLMNATAKVLLEKGYRYLNYEQDLGLFNLRKAKSSFQVHHFLKKYRLQLKQTSV